MLLTNLKAATMRDGYGLIGDAAVLIEGGRIAWVGSRKEAPAGHPATDCRGLLATPGLVDCHTHLVYGGSRANEFEQRLTGVSYAEIAKAGGGIAATVRATRAAPEADLAQSALKRLDSLLAEGVTTIEIKSGYGLDQDTEIRMLRVARGLGQVRPVDVVTSYLGAHALPPEFREDRGAYLDLICSKVIPAVAQQGLADAVDAFCERIAFTPAQCERVLAAARAHGLPVKLHADQLSDLGGAALAARLGALSADHLEYTSEAGVAAMGAAGTVAVLLPGAFYTLRETRLPPVDALRRHGVPIAVATDCNPGSSPLQSPLLAMNLACTLFRLTPAEAFAGFTVHAARALGLQREIGAIAPGLRADLALWDVGRPAELAYAMGAAPLVARWYGGVRG